jgi:hypothetical protein
MGRTYGLTGLVIVISMSLVGCDTASTATRTGPSSADIAVDEATKVAAKVTLPSGTYLKVVLQDGISTEKNSPGDVFNASLSDPVVVDGQIVLPQGSTVHGRVVDVQEPGRVKGRAMIKLVLTSVNHGGKVVPIETQTHIGFAHDTKNRDAKVIGGAAAVGAAIGAIAGGGKGAAEGVMIGGGAGTGTVLATKGKQLHYPPETRLRFRLASPAEL